MNHKERQKKSFKIGSFSVISTIIVIFAIVLFNVGINLIPTTYTCFDVSDNYLYEISEQTKKTAKELDEDITLYWVYKSGNDNNTLGNLLKKYVSLNSKKIHLVEVDPNTEPNFASKYSIESLRDNSVLVESEDRFYYLEYSQIFATKYFQDDTTESGVSAKTIFQGEEMITSAIIFCTTAVLPKAYALTGHGEKTIPSVYKTKIENDNITLETLSIIEKGGVPEDADTLIICNPQSDLSNEELIIIQNFVKRGGDLILLTSLEEKEGTRKNFATLMEGYGLKEKYGILCEGDTDYYPSLSSIHQPIFLMPDMTLHDITYPLRTGGYKVIAFPASAIEVTKVEGVLTTNLLETSEKAYIKKDGYNLTTMEKEDGDEEGSFTIGVLAEVLNDTGERSNVIWYTFADTLMDTTWSEQSNGANQNLFLNTVCYTCELEEFIAIHGKTITSDYLTVPGTASIVWGIVCIGVLPVLIIIAGAVISIYRRRRV